ncbi:MAG: choice-of-anchor Q domain-containing protein [Rudaea sp.]
MNRPIMFMNRRRVLAWLVLMLALPLAHAATIVVTRNDDPSPDGCAAGDCSLREAVIAANADPGSDLIQVPIGTFSLLGALTVSNNVQIYGSADGTTKIDGNGDEPAFSIDGAISVKLAHLTIRSHGAHAVDSDQRADTIFEYVTIPDSDGQVHVLAPHDGVGSLDIRVSDIHSYIDCGDVRVCRIIDSSIQRLQVGEGVSAQTLLIIERTTIDGDLGSGINGGIVVQTNNTVQIVNSTIRNTDVGLDIIAGTPTSVLLDHLDYSANLVPMFVNVPTTVTVVDSEFTSNVRDSYYSGPAAIDAGGGSVWDISRSTFVSNVGDGTVGGAVLVHEAARVAVRNSTFSGNSFTTAAAGNGARGAAIGYVSDPAITSLALQHVTIVAPTISPAGLLGTALGGTGGETGLVLNVLNSIIRGSCKLDTNAMDANFGNIESSADTCDFDANNNTTGVSSATLALGSLGDHGGATQTYQPAFSSPAVDGGAAAFCLDTDQRGYQRPVGAGCDVGALEVGAVDRIFGNGFD